MFMLYTELQESQLFQHYAYWVAIFLRDIPILNEFYYRAY